jgi:hypothetical protein
MNKIKKLKQTFTGIRQFTVRGFWYDILSNRNMIIFLDQVVPVRLEINCIDG